ncbi:hypothetical protein KY285_024563 [Solanum tuberosum]|nr:hypothetical protein KY285_024563 [Solanum tuberosum]
MPLTKRSSTSLSFFSFLQRPPPCPGGSPAGEAGQLELDERQGCNFKEARPDPRTGQKTGPTVIPRASYS